MIDRQGKPPRIKAAYTLHYRGSLCTLFFFGQKNQTNVMPKESNHLMTWKRAKTKAKKKHLEMHYFPKRHAPWVPKRPIQKKTKKKKKKHPPTAMYTCFMCFSHQPVPLLQVPLRESLLGTLPPLHPCPPHPVHPIYPAR